ncbi:unnamed protein product [Cuscuta epithymum]|uniref:Uncharacterized protein n=1 Tax=Cuscuta epithymum TaxID=186058 RepID=A0AAV0CYI4_9ASTE|nr:unnamed protein product [Cuscuta epithymum]
MAAEGTRLKELDSRLKELSREIGRLRDLPSEVRQLSESISATDRDLHKLLEALEIQRKEDECFHTLESIFDSLAKNSSDLNLGSSFGGSRIPFQVDDDQNVMENTLDGSDYMSGKELGITVEPHLSSNALKGSTRRDWAPCVFKEQLMDYQSKFY